MSDEEWQDLFEDVILVRARSGDDFNTIVSFLLNRLYGLEWSVFELLLEVSLIVNIQVMKGRLAGLPNGTPCNGPDQVGTIVEQCEAIARGMIQ